MKRLFLIFTALLLAITGQAQISSCGTEATGEHYQYLKEKIQEARDITHFRSSTQKVPVQIHLVTGSNQISQPGMNDLIAEFDKLNDLYSGANIEFYMSSEVNYIASDKFYNYRQEDESQLAQNDIANVVNVYFVGTITTKNGDKINGYTYFPKSKKDRIFVTYNSLGNSATLAHEMGHYFALIHTHGISGLDREAVSGENCDFAGDLICDTPADPNLQGKVNTSGCEYIGDATDQNGAPYNPDTRNLMSYSPSICKAEFTPDQLSIIARIMTEEKSYLEVDERFQPVSNIVSNSNFNTEVSNDLEVKLYRNPSSKQVGLEILNGYDGEFQVEAYSISGKLVYQSPVSTYNSGSLITINLPNESQGIYLINVRAKRQQITKKVMVM